MLKKYLTKFTIDVLPSVAATVIGAYIVNHYIVTKPDVPAAAALSAVESKPATKAVESKPADSGNAPASGIKAKGISEKAIFEKTAAERPTVVEKPQLEAKVETKADVKSEAKSADAPAETASIPTRHSQPPREKVRVVLPSPVQPVMTPAVALAPSTVPVAAPPVESASLPEDRRDANDLARAAIERLRAGNDGSQREAARAPDTPRTPEAVRAPESPKIAAAPALRPLPPPITVSTPRDVSDQDAQQRSSLYTANGGFRPTPPADIPLSRPPLDLRAEAAPSSANEHTSVAEDVLSAAKTMFHSVLPK